MWVVQEFPDSWRLLRVSENGKPLAEPVEVERFERTSLGKSEANALLEKLVAKMGQIDEVLAYEG